MGNLLASALMSMLASLATKKFFSQVLAKGLLIFSKQTANEYDDVVAAATAEAWGMPVEEIKKYMEKVEEK